MTRYECRSNNPEVWFAIPSASVDRCRERLPAWRDMGYKIAILQNRERGEIPADLVVWSDTYPGWAESVNILCRDIVPASADIVVSGGDDMFPDPNRTAQQLAREYFERFPDGFGVMQPAGDTFMWAANYCGSPWFARPFFTSMYGGRGPMWGGYRHNWADYELYWVARCMGVLWMRDDAQQFHAHFTRDNEQAPDWWIKHVASHEKDDCARFLARKHTGFPGHEPVGRATTLDIGEMLLNDTGIAEWRWNETCSDHGAAGRPKQRLTEAMERCSSRGLHRVAVYGAGSHTRRAGMALAEPPVTIVAIIDDSPAQRGRSLWGYPILSMNEVIAQGIDAIVLSSDSHEQTLWDKASEARRHGIHVERLYGNAEPASQSATLCSTQKGAA